MAILATPTPRMLPVWSTVWACYVAVARNIGQLVRITWLWFLILLPLYAVVLWLIWAIAKAGSSAQIVNAATLLPAVVELPVLASMAVAWHRLLLRAERVTSPAYCRVDGIVWRYALLSLVLLAVPMPITALYLSVPPSDWYGSLGPNLFVLLSEAAFALLIGVGLACIPVFARLSLMLPAVALGEDASPSRVWRMTRNNTLRLVVSSIPCAAPPMLLSLLVRRFDDTTSLPSYVIGGLIELAGGAVLMIFGVTLLSLAYRFFSGPQDDGGSPAA